MKRMLQWLFNITATMSLLLILVTAVLWVRSCSTYEVFYYTWGYNNGSFYSGHYSGVVLDYGRISVVVGRFEPFNTHKLGNNLRNSFTHGPWGDFYSDGWNHVAQEYKSSSLLQGQIDLGFNCTHYVGDFPPNNHLAALTVPFWFVLVV